MTIIEAYDRTTKTYKYVMTTEYAEDGEKYIDTEIASAEQIAESLVKIITEETHNLPF